MSYGCPEEDDFDNDDICEYEVYVEVVNRTEEFYFVYAVNEDDAKDKALDEALFDYNEAKVLDVERLDDECGDS